MNAYLNLRQTTFRMFFLGLLIWIGFFTGQGHVMATPESGAESPVQSKTAAETQEDTAVPTEFLHSGTFGTSPWDIDQKGVLRIHAGMLSHYSKDYGFWRDYSDDIKSIIVEPQVYEAYDLSYVFADLANVKTIDANNLQIRYSKKMTNVFRNDVALTTLNIDNWIVESTQDISYMFANTPSLESLDLSFWNTQNLKTAVSTFEDSGVKSLDISRFNMTKVTDASYMFKNAKNLMNLDVSRWKTGQLKNMTGLFSGAEKLTALEVSHWNTGQVTAMSELFQNTKGLTKLDLSNWDTTQVNTPENMTDMLAFGNQNQMWQLTLGPKTRFFPTAHLPAAPGQKTPIVDPTTEDTYYSISNNWQAVGPNDTVHTAKGPYYTADTLLQAYSESPTPGLQTFVWAQRATMDVALRVPTLDFGQMTTISGLHYPNVADWHIEVQTNSAPDVHPQGTLSVNLSKPFRSETGQVLEDILVFRDLEHELTPITKESQSVYKGPLENQGITNLAWGEDQGFLLNITPAHKVTPGIYQAELTWNMTVSL